MPKESLDEREFELINIVGAQIGINQRNLSRHMDLSLGAINMLIRRLIAKGYIRIEQLNQRKVKYILTPKGFAEKMRKSIKYTVKTLHSISLIKDRLQKIILKLYEEGERHFVIFGESDLAVLVEKVCNEMPSNDYVISYVTEFPKDRMKGTVIICKENVDTAGQSINNRIDLIQELAKDNNFISANIKRELQGV